MSSSCCLPWPWMRIAHHVQKHLSFVLSPLLLDGRTLQWSIGWLGIAGGAICWEGCRRILNFQRKISGTGHTLTGFFGEQELKGRISFKGRNRRKNPLLGPHMRREIAIEQSQVWKRFAKGMSTSSFLVEISVRAPSSLRNLYAVS